MNAQTADRITSLPETLEGKPCIRGTRIPVYLVLKALADPAGLEKVFEAYPELEPEDIQAALNFAADWMELEETENRRTVTA